MDINTNQWSGGVSGTAGTYYPVTVQPATCPCCGYCSHCGRSNQPPTQPVLPYVVWSNAQGQTK